MGEFILILLISHVGPVVIAFPSRQACENAKAIAVEEFYPRNLLGDKIGSGPRAVCVPRGTP